MEDKSKNSGPVEIVKGQLYWVSSSKPPRGVGKAFFFNIDDDLKYYPFFKDFGPLNIAQTYRFVTELEKLLSNPSYSDCPIYHHTSIKSAKRANAAYLMGAFQVLILGRTADQAWEYFKNVKPSFKPFRDASYLACSYKCTILDCLRGLEFAIKAGWFNLKEFDVKDYEFYERVENGDMNWIIPGKFLAFCTPMQNRIDKDGYTHFTPEDYVPIFKKKGIKTVIRLNKPNTYNANDFTKNGINHHCMYFVDGTTPDLDLADKFVENCENAKGGIAVHCKAGLGRTGSMLGMFIMKHYRIPAAAFIGWIRICRPGSVLGPQQQWLNKMQERQFKLGLKSPIYAGLDDDMKDLIERFSALGIKSLKMNEDEARIYREGQEGQADDLNRRKRR